MSSQRALQSATAPAQQPQRRCYSVAQICEALQFDQRTFFRLRKSGQLPFLEELRPRLGRVVRYRADLVDRYLSGEWNQSRSFRSHAAKCAKQHTSSTTA